MRVLIVESKPDLGMLWSRHLERFGARVVLAQGQADAIGALQDRLFDVIVLDLVISEGSAFAISDYVSYRQPSAKIIFVTNSSFFSDGSIFQFCANACAFVTTATPPEDLAALVEHHAAEEESVSRPWGTA